jgi:Fe-Mn family superoxide dismutase
LARDQLVGSFAALAIYSSTSQRTVAHFLSLHHPPNQINLSIATMSEHTLPQLPYAYNGLEPAISEEIMTIHHTKHHQLYVTNLNNAIKAYNSAISSNDVRKQIELQSAIKFNGGGHINHSLFWKNLAPAKEGGGQLHDGPLKQAIERDFGSLDNLKSSFNATIATIQGSGWGWLGFNPKNSKLEVVTTKDQDPLISHHPIIGVDAWEHAFYLQYKNVKAGELDRTVSASESLHLLTLFHLTPP